MNCSNEPQQPNQKDWKFIKELSEPVNFHFNWTRSSINSNEADLSQGVSIKNDFPDPEHRLETACEDLNNFFADSGLITNGDYKIIIQKIDTECFESYRLDVSEDSCKMQPVKKFSAGAVQASVWKSQGKNDKETFSVSIEKRYKDKDEKWKSTNYLNSYDIPKAQLILAEAFRYLNLKISDGGNNNA